MLATEEVVTGSPERRWLRLSGRVPVAMVAACPFPANRGTPIRIQQMGEALGALGYDVHVVTYPLSQPRPVTGMSIHRIPGVVGYREFSAGPNYTKLFVLDPLLVRTLYRVVREHRIRIIHAHHFEGALCALIVRRMLGGIKVIYDAHTSLRDELLHYDFPMPRTLKKVASAILDSAIPRWCDRVITVSDTLRDFVIEQGVPASKVTVIPMAVNTGEFLLEGHDRARAELSLPDAKTVLYTGNLAPFQGVDTLLRSMVRVVARRADARCIIVGKHTPAFVQMARDLGIAHAVTFAGEQPFETVRKYLAASDVVVLPRNNAPGFPLKLLNYMAAGKAIVAFRGSSKEVLRHTENGYVVPDGDENAFADGILYCLGDESASARMGREALRTAGGFAPDELAHRLGPFYESILAQGEDAWITPR